jgi:hypothetical protein
MDLSADALTTSVTMEIGELIGREASNAFRT